MRKLYTAVMTNVGGRDGKVSSPDGKFAFPVAAPESMGGDPGDSTNPEQLFAAGYSSCFNGALNLILQKSRVKYDEAKVTAEVSLLEDPADKSWRIGVNLKVSITGLDKESAQKYTELAHKACPYSKAIAGNVEVNLEVI